MVSGAMKYIFMIKYLSTRAAIASLVLFSILLGACSIEITRLQREQLGEQAKLIASAINYSASHTLQSLKQMPAVSNDVKGESDINLVMLADSFVSELRDYGIVNTEMLIIDKAEILIEFFYGKPGSLKMPRLLQSWLVIFSYKAMEQPRVAAIIPVWHVIEAVSNDPSYGARNYNILQNEFKLLLNQELNKYSLSLNNNNGEFI